MISAVALAPLAERHLRTYKDGNAAFAMLCRGLLGFTFAFYALLIIVIAFR